MPNIVALILAGGRVDELSVLTIDRPKSAVPFAGNYRVIDFALSNLMHSRIGRVGILSQYHSASLITHIGTGHSWDMVGRHRRVTLLPPSSGQKNWDWYRGTADAVAQNMEFIVDNEPDLVLILSGDHIYHLNYQELVDFHLEQKADVTVGFVRVPRQTPIGSAWGTSRRNGACPEARSGNIGKNPPSPSPLGLLHYLSVSTRSFLRSSGSPPLKNPFWSSDGISFPIWSIPIGFSAISSPGIGDIPGRWTNIGRPIWISWPPRPSCGWPIGRSVPIWTTNGLPRGSRFESDLGPVSTRLC